LQQNSIPNTTEAGEVDEEDEEAREAAEAEAARLVKVSLFKLHGDLSQVDRTKVFFAFCKAPSGIMFCTDVGK
jgi:superfamily II DNA/RNA helicase